MLVHDRATPLARRRMPEGYLEMRARIGRAGLQDDRAGGATISDLVAGLRAAIKMRDDGNCGAQGPSGCWHGT